MVRKFAVNVMGYIEDNLDKYSSDDIERLLNRIEVTVCFAPLNVVGVTAKQLPDDTTNIDAKDVKRRYRVKMSRSG